MCASCTVKRLEPRFCQLRPVLFCTRASSLPGIRPLNEWLLHSKATWREPECPDNSRSAPRKTCTHEKIDKLMREAVFPPTPFPAPPAIGSLHPMRTRYADRTPAGFEGSVDADPREGAHAVRGAGDAVGGAPPGRKGAAGLVRRRERLVAHQRPPHLRRNPSDKPDGPRGLPLMDAERLLLHGR